MTDKKSAKSKDASKPKADVKAKAARCPMCRRAAATATFSPFCSKRCADADLSQWLTGGYRVPVQDEPDTDELDGGAADVSDDANGDTSRRLH